MATPQPKTETLSLAGELDLHRSPEIKEMLGSIIQRKASRVLIDMSEVTYIDSSGLAALIEALQRITAYGGDLAIFGLQQNVQNIFGVARLDQVFQIFPDLAAAHAAA